LREHELSDIYKKNMKAMKFLNFLKNLLGSKPTQIASVQETPVVVETKVETAVEVVVPEAITPEVVETKVEKPIKVKKPKVEKVEKPAETAKEIKSKAKKTTDEAPKVKKVVEKKSPAPKKPKKS